MVTVVLVHFVAVVAQLTLMELLVVAVLSFLLLIERFHPLSLLE